MRIFVIKNPSNHPEKKYHSDHNMSNMPFITLDERAARFKAAQLRSEAVELFALEDITIDMIFQIMNQKGFNPHIEFQPILIRTEDVKVS